MWIKLLGAVFIIGAGVCLGFITAYRYSERPRQIQHIRSCLTSLRSYINYAVMPLADALALSSKGVCGPVGDLLRQTANLLTIDSGMSPQSAFTQAIEKTSNLSLGNDEIDALMVFGANLGNRNCEEQDKYLVFVLNRLEDIEREASRIRDQNVKMYRYLGICGGLLIVIVLL